MLPIENVTSFFRSMLKIRGFCNMISGLVMPRIIGARAISWNINWYQREVMPVDALTLRRPALGQNSYR